MEFLLSHCQAVIGDHGGLLLTLFLGGLMGSATHCVGMCGPFVVAQTASLEKTPSLFARVRGLALMPYHLGRMTTYMLLGILAASLSGMVFSVPLQRGIAVVLLTVAGVLFLASAVPSLKRSMGPRLLNGWVARFGAGLGRVAKPFFQSPTPWHRYALGVTLGFLPCGLLAAALMAVAATADPISAAFGMAAFCVGTMPALFLTGAGGRYALDHLPIRFSTLARGVMVFNSLSLFIIAGGMILPGNH
ncbi:sulfite exporter TauE/SafE family protein [Kordiimonas gwangyangensis]|uniref:sulfite exporter TauE/SafE family protein n=1 Tax=Kordiimonas gwangyangensis TaxID=288022 RepID=UPI000365F58F|nr:sulfite exporter TauE/SafE family protein [Kordiimonas gwangyangensis]